MLNPLLGPVAHVNRQTTKSDINEIYCNRL